MSQTRRECGAAPMQRWWEIMARSTSPRCARDGSRRPAPSADDDGAVATSKRPRAAADYDDGPRAAGEVLSPRAAPGGVSVRLGGKGACPPVKLTATSVQRI